MEKHLNDLTLEELLSMLPENILFRDAEVTHWALIMSKGNCAVVGMREVSEDHAEEVWFYDKKREDDFLLQKDGNTPRAAVKSMLLLLRQEHIIQF